MKKVITGIIGSPFISPQTVEKVYLITKPPDVPEPPTNLSSKRDPELKCKKGHRYRESESVRTSYIGIWKCINCGREL